ncbi:MAG TPA: hypothetical protein RMG48_09120 [Myxococcales bacterium LLY-WYZ-16_1]|jgi:hypothetical protein|nr:hypothetical protein [Myxococcales bacterium LLY-WYZ-16_1]
MILWAAVIGAAVAQANVRVDAGVTTTHRTGQFARALPVNADRPNGNGLAYEGEVVPSVSLDVTGKTQRFTLTYSARAFYRWVEEGILLDRPGFWQRGLANYALDISSRTTWTSSLLVSGGEIPIAQLLQPADPGTGPDPDDELLGGGVVPDDPFLLDFIVGGTTGLAVGFDERNSASFDASIRYRDPGIVEGGDQPEGFQFSQVTRFRLGGRYGFRWDRRNQFLFDTQFRSFWVSGGNELAESSSQVITVSSGWAHQLSRNLNSELLAGAQVVFQQTPDEDVAGVQNRAERDELQALPFASARLTLGRAPSGSFSWQGSLLARLDGQLNQVLGRFIPAISLVSGLSATFVDWTGSISASFRTTLDGPFAFDGSDAAGEDDPTLFSDVQTSIGGTAELSYAPSPLWRLFTRFRAQALTYHLSIVTDPATETPFPNLEITGLLGLEVRWSSVPPRAMQGG